MKKGQNLKYNKSFFNDSISQQEHTPNNGFVSQEKGHKNKKARNISRKSKLKK